MSSGLRRFLGQISGWDRHSFEEKRVLRYRVSALIAPALAFFPLPMRSLLRWAKSDKDLPGQHSYGATYGRLFRRLKYRRVRLLEIGIGGYGTSLGGRSLLAWRAFFPFGRIVACDIEDKSGIPGSNVAIYRADQSSETDMLNIAAKEGPFDIIIDDGSHLSRHQILTFYMMFGYLKNGGRYIVEDVQTSYWLGRVGGIEWDGANVGSAAFADTACGHFAELTKYLNFAEFMPDPAIDARMLAAARQIVNIQFEHNLIIITKGANDEPSYFADELAARPDETAKLAGKSRLVGDFTPDKSL